ncbi:MAG: hypothetical protein WBA57_23560 [Elainellaceae cyanobacterium]
MKSTHDYVLILDREPSDLQSVDLLLGVLQCPAIVAESTDQVLARANQGIPYLIILVGNHHQWPAPLLNDLRHAADAVGGTILSLTDVHSPMWAQREDTPGLDGFLVKPLSRDVLASMMQAAWAKHLCRSRKSIRRSRTLTHTFFPCTVESGVDLNTSVVTIS